MNFVTVQCIAKLAHCLAAAAKVEDVILVDDDEEDGNHSIGNKKADDANNLNEPNRNDLNEPNVPIEPNNPNEHHNVPYPYRAFGWVVIIFESPFFVPNKKTKSEFKASHYTEQDFFCVMTGSEF
jgi:hypothetical protein